MIAARVGVLVLGLAVGCGGAQDSAREPSPPPKIVVLDPGAAPRRQLRFELAAHDIERVKTRFEGTMRTSYGGGDHVVSGTNEIPAIESVVRVEVTGFTASGDAVIRATAERVARADDGGPPTARATDAALAKLAGQRITYRLSPTGIVSAVSVAAAGGNTPQDVGFFDSEMSRLQFPPVPDVAVGVGATWRVNMRAKLAGVTWNWVVTYRLVGLDGDVASIAAKAEVHASEQPLSVEPNRIVKLTEGEGQITSESKLQLHHLGTTGWVHTSVELGMTVEERHGGFGSLLETSTELSFEPLQGDAHTP